MGIISEARESNKKSYKLEINTKKLVEIKQISAEIFKKFKNNTRIQKISLHIEIEYFDNDYEE